MCKHKIFLLAVLFVILLSSTGCAKGASALNPTVENGVINLSGEYLDVNTVMLNGKWEFYQNRLIPPAQLNSETEKKYIGVPSSWNKYSKSKGVRSGYGYATYKLTFITDKSGTLALKIPRLHTAYKLWVNGDLKASAGIVGTQRSEMTPQYLPQIAFFQARQGDNEIVIHISNFYHRSGGMLEGIIIGSETQVLALRYKALANNLFLSGILLFMGLYHIIFFFFRRKNYSPLYFGVFCVLIGIRTLLVGESYLLYYFPQLSWEFAHKIMTLTYYLGVPVIATFFLYICPNCFCGAIVKTAQTIGVCFGLLVFFAPARVFSLANPLYQLWSVFISTYILIVLFKTAIYKNKGCWFIVMGALVLILAGLNDIIFYSVWLNDYKTSILRTLIRTGNLSSFGQLVFVFINSVMLAKSFSDLLDREEIITAKLTEVNVNLDKIVLQRTKALSDSNNEIEKQKIALERANEKLLHVSLIDPLTGVWNRRKYNETIIANWQKCLRQQETIALMMVDIDFFKNYNDAYGHLAGDECLIKVADAINAKFSDSNGIVARYGGEEFIVILTKITEPELIAKANETLKAVEALEILHKDSAVSNYITVSIGASLIIPNKDSSYDSLFGTVDKALYQAKISGRNQLKFLHARSFSL